MGRALTDLLTLLLARSGFFGETKPPQALPARLTNAMRVLKSGHFSPVRVAPMKSSSGQYYVGLDHVRALAAFLVFTWHFVEVASRDAQPPMFPLSILAEGHTGVALFMVLSGYLFAKLLDGKSMDWGLFLWNRVLRLAPLMLVVVVLAGIVKYQEGWSLLYYAKRILGGAVLPTLPNGGWSITAEFHFYLILPGLLLMARRHLAFLGAAIAASIAIRTLLHMQYGEVQYLAYWTIIGRIDQFILGVLAYHLASLVTGRHMLVVASLAAFAAFYGWFDAQGGFFLMGSYPSPSRLWIYMPTIEGLAYGMAIAWYDTSFKHSMGPISRFIALVGTCSFSIYLLHPFFVHHIYDGIELLITPLNSIYKVLGFSIVGFLLMVPIAYGSYRAIESPFFKYRTKYIKRAASTEAPIAESIQASQT